MTWLTPNFTIDDALAAEHDIYDLLVGPIFNTSLVIDPVFNPGALIPAGWGSMDDPINGDLQFPAFGQPGLPSLAGIAIGPQSTVDRCWVSWFAEKIAANADTRLCSVGSPLLFSMPAKPGIPPIDGPAPAMTAGNLFIFPSGSSAVGLADSTTLPTIYSPGPPADPTMSRVLGVGAPNGVFVGPLLHLILYLRGPYSQPPTKRFPQVVRSSGNATLPFVQNTEVCIGQIPVYGRKHIKIEAWTNSCSVANPTTIRIGALRGLLPFTHNQPNQWAIRESTEDFDTLTVPFSPTTFQLDDRNIDYLTINALVKDNAPLPTACPFTVYAYD